MRGAAASQLTSARVQVAETVYRCPDAAFAFFHDYLVTDNYYIVLDNPTRMDFRKLLLEYTTGKACIAECIYLDPTRRMKARAPCCQVEIPVCLEECCTFAEAVWWSLAVRGAIITDYKPALGEDW